MAKVAVCSVNVNNNPGPFLSPFELEITFECLEPLPDDLEWKLLYVGSAESEEFDQVLDTVYVGPVPEGRHKFQFEAPAPDAAKIPKSDIVGVTVILLTCAYKGAEFLRVGYYVSNEYDSQELMDEPPEEPDFNRLQRNILASNPRVTKFKINWDDGTTNGETENGDNNEMMSADSTSDQPGTSADSGMSADAVAVALNLENIPPCPANTLPPQKDPALSSMSSPMKAGLRPSTAFCPPPEDVSNSADMDLD